MIRDLASAIEAGASIESDILIVGAGPAGISLALALRGSGRRVLLIEAGGMQFTASSSHYDAESVGIPYPIAASRQRFFGGTSNHWGGWCRPLDPIDLEEKPWMPLSGWPLTYEELSRWYPRANDILEIPTQNYEAEGQVADSALLPFTSEDSFINRAFRFSPPTRFGDVYGDDLVAASDIDVLIEATLVRIEHEGGRVIAAHVADPQGGTRRIVTGRMILATGGLEVPRILLHTGTSEKPALGNEHDWVGRCFMEHFGYTPGYLMTRAELRYDLHRPEPNAPHIHPILVPGPDLMRRHELMNALMTLTPESADPAFPPRALESSGLASAIIGMPWRYRLTMVNEQRPNPNSRVTLGDDRDEFGLRKLRLDWQIDQGDFASITRVMGLLSSWLGATGLGRLQHSRPVSPETTAQLTGGMHHMGTARMSRSATTGVVDPQCLVHGTENLYIASSAVFPTAGYANPTLTIVALALRLAQHLIDTKP